MALLRRGKVEPPDDLEDVAVDALADEADEGEPEGALASYKVIYRGGLPEHPKAKVSGLFFDSPAVSVGRLNRENDENPAQDNAFSASRHRSGGLVKGRRSRGRPRVVVRPLTRPWWRPSQQELRRPATLWLA